jgi:arabinogalactan endo-1,4-beta-galactosidase
MGRTRLRLFVCALPAIGFFMTCRVATATFYDASDISEEAFFQSAVGSAGTTMNPGGGGAGAVYKATALSAAQSPDQILYNAGQNMFRIRLFVNPNTNYTATQGAIQTTASDIALMQSIKANDPNAAIELDMHYSDAWADPGHQTKPAAWLNDTQAQLNTDVSNYTINTLTSFKDAGVMPDIVQIGNETNSGFIWGTTAHPATGRITFNTNPASSGWANYAQLVNTAISAVRTVQGTGPHVQVAIHIANGAQSGEPQFFYNGLTAAGVTDYDVLGVSFYPNSAGNPSITLSGLNTNLTALANTSAFAASKKIIVEETNYPSSTRTGYDGWAETAAGQAQEYMDVKNLLLSLPHNVGEGLVYWEPEGVASPGVSVYNNGQTALFSLQPGTTNTWILNPNMLDAFSVPEPTSMGIFAIAMFGFGSRRRSARK